MSGTSMDNTPVFSKGAVASPHALASEAGRHILQEGGNAVEAMVAMAATIAVVYPHMNSLGGDGFWIIRDPQGKVHALEACGPAGALANIKRYRDKGYETIPARGPDAALTVAGAVSGWQLALGLSKGKMPLSVLLANSIHHGKEGFPVSPSQERTQPKLFDAIQKAPGFAEHFLTDDKIPDRGSLRKTPQLAATLEQLSRAGLDDFYRGDIGREIATDLERIGSPVTRHDIEAFKARMVTPLHVRLKDVSLYNCPPPTQGLASLLTLGINDQLGVKAGESLDYHHGLVEAVKRAFSIRDRVVTDPDRLRVDPQSLLKLESFAREASRIAMDRAGPYPAPNSNEGDTVWLGAIDDKGWAVSYIQSIYWEYGSGCVLPSTGIHWQNRGCSFSLDPHHLNALEPGRKPFHTLNPPFASFDDGRIMSYGTMGGEGQPQFQAQIFTRYARMGMSPLMAVDAPRWLFGRSWGDETSALTLENRFDESLLKGLRQRGHDVVVLNEGYSDALGHAGMLILHPQNGRIEAVHDPRSDGGSAGI
jgi:oxamate amidohydrolase